MYATLRRDWQITLPESIIQETGMGEGDTLECRLEDGEIRLRPATFAGEKTCRGE